MLLPDCAVLLHKLCEMSAKNWAPPPARPPAPAAAAAAGEGETGAGGGEKRPRRGPGLLTVGEVWWSVKAAQEKAALARLRGTGRGPAASAAARDEGWTWALVAPCFPPEPKDEGRNERTRRSVRDKNKKEEDENDQNLNNGGGDDGGGGGESFAARLAAWREVVRPFRALLHALLNADPARRGPPAALLPLVAVPAPDADTAANVLVVDTTARFPVSMQVLWALLGLLLLAACAPLARRRWAAAAGRRPARRRKAEKLRSRVAR